MAVVQLVPSATFACDEQHQARTSYDGNVRSETDYDAASVFFRNEWQTETGTNYPLTARIAEFLAADTTARGFGDLTTTEIQTIQQAVDRTGQSVTVVGSAANGTRTAASDIDYLFQMPEFPSSMNDADAILPQLP